MAFKNPIRRVSQLVADRITGALIQTAAAGLRVVLDPIGRIKFYTGAASEELSGEVFNISVGDISDMTIRPAKTTGAARPALHLRSSVAGGAAIALDADDGITLGAGAPVRGIDLGAEASNADASGEITVTHALGAAPTTVVAGMTNAGRPWAPIPMTGSHTATQLRFKMVRTTDNTAAPGGSACSFVWLAVR